MKKLAALLLVFFYAGCTQVFDLGYDCPEGSKTCEEADNGCCPISACPGECVPLPPIDFHAWPVLLWTGQEGAAPECPARAPRQVWEGHADLDASISCPTCQCDGSFCRLPSGMTADAQICPGGGTQTAFNPPSDWDGSCTSPTTVPSNLLRSVIIQPVTEAPCEPATKMPTDLSSPWGTYARACAGEALPGLCGDPGLTCMPTSEPPPPGFEQCIVYTGQGQAKCPMEYPEEHVLYEDVDDSRGCTPCECTQTAVSSCVAAMSIYQDEVCTDTLIGAYMMGLGGMAQCLPIGMPGAQLGSMSAQWLVNQPGKCEVTGGGEPVGTATPTGKKVFCCQP